MKKTIIVLSGVVIACMLSGCVNGALYRQQEKERTALSNKQQADRQVERSKKALVVSTAVTADAAHNLEQAKQKQKDADATLQSILFPSLSISL